MIIEKKLRSAERFRSQGNVPRFVSVLRDLIKNHSAQLSYQNLTSAAYFLSSRNLEPELALECVQLAMKLDFRRIDAPEIMFTIFFTNGKPSDLENCNHVLELLVEHCPADKPELLRKYKRWQLYVFNKQAHSSALIEFMKRNPGIIDKDEDDVGQTILAIVNSYLEFNMVTEARLLLTQYIPNPPNDDPNQLNAHAKVLQSEGEIDLALEMYSKVEQLAIEGPAVEATWNKSLAELAAGRLDDGWADYEIRWKWDSFPSAKPKFDIPSWRGESLEGKSILMWGEQGIGDEILFLTQLPSVLKFQPKNIGIAVSKSKLHPILKHWLPGHDLFLQEDLLGDVDYVNSHFDFYLPLGSIPFVAGGSRVIGNTNVLGHGGSIKRLREKILADFPGKRRIVGLSWRSGLLLHRRVGHYISVDGILDAIKDAPDDVLFLVLQYGLNSVERAKLERMTEIIFIPEEDFYEDLLAQSVYIRCCDLVVTSSSVCFALAGITEIPTVTWGPKRHWPLQGTESGYPWFPRSVHYIRCDVAWDLGLLVQQIKKLMKKFYSF